jgi:hypothetical protein
LQEAAIVLQSYKRESECAQVIAALKTLAADPERAIASGDTDESKAEVLDKVKAPKPSLQPERKPRPARPVRLRQSPECVC